LSFLWLRPFFDPSLCGILHAPGQGREDERDEEEGEVEEEEAWTGSADRKRGSDSGGSRSKGGRGEEGEEGEEQKLEKVGGKSGGG